MRIIGGELRRRNLKSVPGTSVRPTPDRLREALFNILSTQMEGAFFVDLYAGTGAVGIEALSRGAAKVLLIEHNRAAVQVIHENLRSLGIEHRVIVRQSRAATALATALAADIVFLDPPYEEEKEYGVVLSRLGAEPPPLVIAQHSSRLQLDEEYGQLRRSRVLRQGDNSLSFYTIFSD